MRLIALAVILAVGLLTAPLAAEAQQARRPIIGVTLAGSLPNPYGEALRRALTELGWVDGQNVRLEYRYAEGRPERYPGFFAELLRLNVDVIVAGGGTVAAMAARQATRTTPIIVFVPDPVAAGLVASLERPGGNVPALRYISAMLGPYDMRPPASAKSRFS